MAEVAKKNWFVKHKILTVILVLILLAAIGGASGSNKTANNATTTSKTSTTTAKKSTAQTAKIGEPARDGKFEFVVQSVQCNVMSVGDNPYLTKTPQGQFCLLDVTVKNIGNEKQSLFSENQKLMDSSNKQYSADDQATIYAAPNSATWYSDINPGNSVEGKIVFDLPKSVTPTIAELHDSAYSGGVKVNLQ